MSARVESTPVRESAARPVLIAIVAALGLGALAVGAIRFAFDDRPAAVTSVQAPLWDEGKLDAMQGRQLAAAQPVPGTMAALEPGQLKAILEGRPAERVVTQPAEWDAGMLEAMEGRQLAERFRSAQVGVEDPISPHIPKRSPHE